LVLVDGEGQPLLGLASSVDNNREVVAAARDFDGKVVGNSIVSSIADVDSVEVGIEAVGSSDGEVGTANATRVE
jgi:hypothetical protein